MTKQQLWGGTTLILAGGALLLSGATGFQVTWPFWTIGVGLLMLLSPWTNDLRKQRSMRIGGFWALLTGLVGLLNSLGLSIGYGPVFMIGAGALYLINQKPKQEA